MAARTENSSRRLLISYRVQSSSSTREPPLSVCQIRKLPHVAIILHQSCSSPKKWVERKHLLRRTLIPLRVIMQIKLMIILRIPPRASLHYLRRNLPRFPPLLLHLLGHRVCNLRLLGTVVEDPAAVLSARVPALAI